MKKPLTVHVQKLDAHGRALCYRVERKDAVCSLFGFKTRLWQNHREQKRLQRLFWSSGSADGSQAANRLLLTVMVSMTSSAPFPVVVCPVRRGAIRHGISKALTYYEPELRGCPEKKVASLLATPVLLNVRNTVAQKLAVPSSSPNVNSAFRFAIRKGPLQAGLFLCEMNGERRYRVSDT